MMTQDNGGRSGEPNQKDFDYIALSTIDVRGRIREDLGEVEELAEAIRLDGLLQPIVVRPADGQSLVDGYEWVLIAGGRRYTAFTLLAANKVPVTVPSLFHKIPARLWQQIPQHQQIKLELEENLRRKGMTWQENVLGIAKYHKAAERAAILDKETWGQQATGELLNLSQASVSIALKVAAAIKAGNAKVLEAESLADAIKAMVGEKLDVAQAEIMRRMTAKKAALANILPELPASLVASAAPALVSTDWETEMLSGVGNRIIQTATTKLKFTLEQMAAFYHHGNALEVLPKLKAAGTKIHHIICDPPYGIDMSNLVGDNIERIADTHVVADNVQLLRAFLAVAYNILEEDGFLCMWYDLDHHEKIAEWARAVGFKVQRWPLVWCKTSTCRNSAAQYNVTKATEVCYMFRRSERSVIKKKQAVNYVMAGTAASASHPFCKPFEVWQYLIETVSTEGQTIVDPFAGEGSALAAIFQLKREPIGVEIDEKHIASGLQFLQETLNKSANNDLLSELPL